MAQAAVRVQARALAVAPELVEAAELAVAGDPVAASEAPAGAVELALEAAGRELAAVAAVPVQAVVDPVAGQVWVAEPVVAEERQHLVSG